MQRVPLESTRPLRWFAGLRIAVVAIALAGLAAFEVPGRDSLIVLAAVAAVLALGLLVLVDRAPRLALHPGVALIDLTILAVAEAVTPDVYAAARFLALFLIAAHAHFQGALRGVAIALAAVILLVPVAVAGDPPVSGDLLAWYETLFAASAIAAALFIGRLRSAESTARLRARDLSRRVIEAEGQVRRNLAAALHDGPVQELVSLDLVLDAAHRAIVSGRPERAQELVDEARAMAERNIGSLREEIVGLGPYALDELTLDAAIEQCAPVWSRRFGVPVELELERVDMPNELCGFLFGIAQEAVANAGRHAEASRVDVSFRRHDDAVELRVADDGRGFDGAEPLGPEQAGHIGLATMRERAALAGGSLAIDTSSAGTTIVVRAPLASSA